MKNKKITKPYYKIKKDIKAEHYPIYYIKLETAKKEYKKIIEKTGGHYGIINEGNISFTLYHIERYDFSYDKTENIIYKASYLLYNLIVTHPFADGNKRTAFALTRLFLQLNHIEITATQDGIIELCGIIAEDLQYERKLSHTDVYLWLKNNTKMIKNDKKKK